MLASTLVVLTALGATAGSVAYGASSSEITVGGVSAFGAKCLRNGGLLQDVGMAFTLTNNTSASIKVTYLRIHLEDGTIQQIRKVHAFDDQNSKKLGTALFNASRVAVLSGELLTIPAGQARQVTVYADVSAAGLANSKPMLSLRAGDIGYGVLGSVASTRSIDGNLPFRSKLLIACEAAGPATTTTTTATSGGSTTTTSNGADPTTTTTAAPSASVRISNPNGGQTIVRGTTVGLGWISASYPSDAYVRGVELCRGSVCTNVEAQTQAVPRVPVGGKFNPSQNLRWIVDQSLAAGSDYRVKVCLYSGPTTDPTLLSCDQSDAEFTIA